METPNYAAYLEDMDTLYKYIESRAQKIADSRQDEPTRSAEIKELATALAKAQGEYPRIGFNRDNPYFKSGYADLDAIMYNIRPILSKNGLSVVQEEREIPACSGTVFLITILQHNSGQWISTRTRLLPPKNDPQSYGSTLSYKRRYSVNTLLGITAGGDPADDDAEVAMEDARNITARGTSINNNNYDPRNVIPEVITTEQREEIERKLENHPDTQLYGKICDRYHISNLAGIPKSEYKYTVDTIDSIRRKLLESRKSQ